MTNDENRFLLAAKEAISKANYTIDQVAKTFGFYLGEPGVMAPVNRVVLSRDEKDALFRYLRNLGYRCHLTDFHPSTDGLNHYNIYSQGRTTLGQMASNFYADPTGKYFDTPHGPFLTLEGYYHYLRILDYALRDEDQDAILADSASDLITDTNVMRPLEEQYLDINRLRKLEGADCIRVGRNLKATIYGGTSYRPGAFSNRSELRFMTAMVFKLHSLAIDGVSIGNILSAQVLHDVPLLHYYVMNGRQLTPPHADWLPGVIKRIVKHVDPYGKTFDAEAVINLTGNDDGSL